jgi:mono/diheme cytochrome c family protein
MTRYSRGKPSARWEGFHRRDAEDAERRSKSELRWGLSAICGSPFSFRLCVLCVSAVSLILLTAGCARDGSFQPISMWNQSRLKPLEESPIPDEGSSSRALPPGTVARGQRAQDEPVVSGRSNGRLVAKMPIAVTRQVLERGQARFNIYCSPCHGRVGDGQGMIVKRGFPHPPDYALVRLRNAPDGHYFDVITNGYGVMYSYASRVPPEDRWAITAYIRGLQASRPPMTVDPYERGRRRARRTGIGTRPVRETEQEATP